MLTQRRGTLSLAGRFLLLFGILFLSACGTGARGSATPTPLPAVVSYEKAIFTVERGPIVSERELRGEIVPVRQDDLFFRTSGFVTRVAVKAGDVVKEGDILAEMQVDDLLNQVQQAEIDLDVARADLEKYRLQHAVDIEKVGAEVVMAERRVALAMIELENTYGDSRTRAQINLDIAEQNLLIAEQNQKLIEADNNPYMEQAVRRSELALERLRTLLAERQVIAPYDAIVLRTTVRAGQQSEAYLPAVVVGDPTELVVRTQVDRELTEFLNEGTEVRFYFTDDDETAYVSEYLPNFLPVSTVEQVDTLGLGTNVADYYYFKLPAEISLEEVRVGQQVTMVVVLGRKDDAILLPPAAIREYRGLNFVIIQDGDRRRRVEISEIGLKSEELWEVIADLNEGDQVLGP